MITAQDNVDYCVDKKKVEQSGKYLNFVMQGDPDLEPGSLKRCQGDCDSDEGETILVGIQHIADRQKMIISKPTAFLIERRRLCGILFRHNLFRVE